MEKLMKKYIIAAISTIAVVIWIVFILSNSSKTGVESGSMSKMVCEAINNFFENLKLNITFSEHFVRKSAHFCEYMILSGLLCLDVLSISMLFEKLKQKNIFFRLVIALPVSAAVALFDEFGVQMSTVGRGPSIRDVIIDTSGAAFGVLAVSLFLWICLSVRKR
jgi:VanZ family protein